MKERGEILALSGANSNPRANVFYDLSRQGVIATDETTVLLLLTYYDTISYASAIFLIPSNCSFYFMQININGKLLLAIIFMMCGIGIGTYGYKEMKEAKEIESAIVLISAFGGNSLTNSLLNGLANALSEGVVTSSNIAEELAHQAQKQKQIGILLMLISLMTFISSIYFLWKIGRGNKPIA